MGLDALSVGLLAGGIMAWRHALYRMGLSG
jgi:hypothetical protein